MNLGIRFNARRIGAIVVTIASVVGIHGVGSGEDAANVPQDYAEYGADAVYLDQGWTYDTAEWWYYVSQGTAFMPYEWFVALEQASGDELFSAADHLERLGFLAAPASASNPGGLPIGFSSRQLDFQATEPYKFWKGAWVGLACAACHTGQIRYHGQQIRIEGGAAHLDIEAFGDELGAALAATYASVGTKWPRFVERVLTSGAATTKEELRDSFGKFLQNQVARRSLFDAAQERASEDPTSSGAGRLDAVHRGGNLLLSGPLGEGRNYVPTTAPVSFPALWDTPYFDWVLYNASIRQPLARNVIEALGVGAPVEPNTFLAGTLNHDVLMDNIVDIHRALKQLESPRWPEQLLGKIDQAKAQDGESIFREGCAGCHTPIDREMHAPLNAAKTESPEIAIPTIALDKIGTDPRQAQNFAARIITLEKISGPGDIAYLDAAKTVSGRIVEQWAQQSAANAQTEQEINAGRANEFRGMLAYRARPLNGIWATAPYLHNGSVPSLYEVLLPPAQRPRIFYMGGWEFDPLNVGIVSGSPFAGAFKFDTRLPGNSNAGHPYGTGLSKPDRMALIEYLKTL